MKRLAGISYAERVKRLAGISYAETNAYRKITERDHYTTPNFRNVPYVCLRVPTGGGKTLMDTHAVGQIGRRLLAIDNPACLWVTPSTTIRDQTRRGLQDKFHTYRLAWEDEFGSAIEVLTLEAVLTRSQILQIGGPAVMIVTTIQSYRIRGETDDDFSIRIEEDSYFPSQLYEGSHRFKKHAFADIGAMNGEELECAIRIDTTPM